MRLGKQCPSCLWEGAGPGLRQAGRQRWGRAPPVPAKLRAPDGRGLTGGAGSGSGPCLVAFSTGIVAAAQSRARQAEAAAQEASGGPSPPPRPGVVPRRWPQNPGFPAFAQGATVWTRGHRAAAGPAAMPPACLPGPSTPCQHLGLGHRHRGLLAALGCAPSRVGVAVPWCVAFFPPVSSRVVLKSCFLHTPRAGSWTQDVSFLSTVFPTPARPVRVAPGPPATALSRT